MDILIMIGTGILNILCFLIGAKVGQKVVKGEPIEIPNINPIERMRQRQERVAAEIEQDKMNTILRNIEVYDGTSAGQKEVPGEVTKWI